MKLHHFKGFHIVSKLFISVFTIGSVVAISLFPFVIYKNKYLKTNSDTHNHESIHIMQQMECGLVGMIIYFLSGLVFNNWLISLPVLFLFGILYLFFFLINRFRFKNWDEAYENIPFEKEAYRNSNRSVYLGLRKPFAWVNYIRSL